MMPPSLPPQKGLGVGAVQGERAVAHVEAAESEQQAAAEEMSPLLVTLVKVAGPLC